MTPGPFHGGTPIPKGVSLFCSIKHLTGTLAPRGGAILAGKEGVSLIAS